MYLVDEQHVVALEVREYADQVAGPGQCRAGGRLDRRGHFVRDDVCERGLTQPRRAVQQHVIHRLVALAGGGNAYPQLLEQIAHADALVQRGRPELNI